MNITETEELMRKNDRANELASVCNFLRGIELVSYDPISADPW